MSKHLVGGEVSRLSLGVCCTSTALKGCYERRMDYLRAVGVVRYADGQNHRLVDVMWAWVLWLGSVVGLLAFALWREHRRV